MWDADLQTLAAFAEIVGAGTIVSGLVFGLIQLRHYRIQQRDSIAQSLAQTFYDEHLGPGDRAVAERAGSGLARGVARDGA